MKKLFWVFLILLTLSFVAACGDKNNGDDDQPKEKDIDLGGQEFVIMVDTPNRQDPRTNEYERMYQQQKAQKIAEVEAKYNCKVVFKPYTSSWGHDRRNQLKEDNLAGKKEVHVFEVNSSWIPYLAENGVISDLKPYIDTLIDKETEYWIEKEGYTKFKGGIYGYDDMLNMAESGMFYNIELLGEVLGEENKDLPSRLWLEGNWTWETFEQLVDQLYAWVIEQTESYHVIGGMGYNWAYHMAAANGLNFVDNNFQIQFMNDDMIETFEFLRRLYNKSVVGKSPIWQTTTNWSLTAIPEFSAGKVFFHDGESWYLSMQNRWLRTDQNRDFDIGFVPFPVGPNVKDDMSNYYISCITGQATYVISSAFDKNRIPQGYEHMFLHDESIFKIWRDLQYFSPVGRESYANQFITRRAVAYYGSESSVEAHRTILNKLNVEYFYYIEGMDNHEWASGMGQLGLAVTEPGKDPRTALQSLYVHVATQIFEQFGIEQEVPTV